jgi:uncharacterized membrane protein
MEGFSILVGTVLLMALILAPGLALTMALFPKWRQITFVERAGLAVLLGTLPQVLLYFVNKNTGIGISAMTSISSIVLVVAMGVFVYYRRKSSPA